MRPVLAERSQNDQCFQRRHFYLGPTVRRAIEFCVAVVALMLLADAHAQLIDPARTTDDSLRLYAVNIIQDPPQSWTGYGIYLGKGLVLTTAYVVGRAARTNPSVRI